MGIPVTMFYNLMSGILRALGDSKTPLKYLLIASGLNIVFDLVFIIALDFGVTGAAAATVLSQAISGVMCFVYMKRRLPVLGYQEGEKAVDTELMKHIAALGLPMAFQFSITAVGSIILQTAVNTLGSVAVAGISAGQKVQNLVSAPMDTLGVTMATYGGQNLGARKIDRIHEGTRAAFAVSMIYTIVITAVVFFAGETMTHIFLRSGDPDYTAILAAVRHFLRVTCLFYPVLGLLFLFRNLLQGLGFSLVTMLAGAVELAARIIVSFGFVYRIGFDAAVFAAPSAWTAACVLLIFIYLIKIRSLDRLFCTKAAAIGKPAHN
jgi:Na+-driven multidrug efflux pump